MSEETTAVLTCSELASEYIAETGIERVAAELVARIELGEVQSSRQRLTEDERAELDAAASRQDGRELLVMIKCRSEPIPMEHEAEALSLFGMTEEDAAAAKDLVERLQREEGRRPRPGDHLELPGAREDLATCERLGGLQQETAKQVEKRRRRLLTDFMADPPVVLAGPTDWLGGRVYPEVWDNTGRVDDFLQAVVRLGEEEREQERLEYIETLLAEAVARAEEAEGRARLGVAGVNAMTKNPRMISDLMARGEIEISPVEWNRLTSGFVNFSSLSPNAFEVFLGLSRQLRDVGMPNVGGAGAPTSLEPVLVSLPGGLAQLADLCGYERTEVGEHGGMKHARHVRRRMALGVEDLTTTIDLIHIYRTRNGKNKGRNRRALKKRPKEYIHVRAAIVQIVNEGSVVEGPGERRVLAPHAIHLAIHPMALLGARTIYEDVPGDLPARYHDALHTLYVRALDHADLRAIYGSAKLRSVISDWCFMVWCISHKKRGTQTISDEKLMDQIGLSRDLSTRQAGRAMKKLDRAVFVAIEMGVLLERRIEKPGMSTYVFRAAEPPGP